AKKGLPASDALPLFHFDAAELQYPAHLNAAAFFLDRNVEEGRGDQRAICSGDGTVWTYDDVLAKANQIAHVLRDDLGVKPGERVLLRAANTPMLAACWFAVLKVGAICVTTMPLYRAAELGIISEKAHVRVALCDIRL